MDVSRRYGDPDLNPIAAVRDKLADRRIRARWEPADFALAAGGGIALLLLIGVVIYLWLQSFGFASSSTAIRHIYAGRGCAAAAQVGFSQSVLGQPGYWPKQDGNGNGVACETGEG